MDENISRQAEEIEALSSIYGDQWQVEDERNRAYSIHVTEGDYNVLLYITLPPDYPSHDPPLYLLSAPSLNRQDKQELGCKLNNIYLENIGENVLFQWAEAVRDFLQAKLNYSSIENQDDAFSIEEINSTINSLSLEPIRCEELYIHHGDIITDRKSIFQGHVATISSVDQVKQMLSILMKNKKIAQATHNIYAYRVQKVGQPGCLAQDCDDDGESAAGSRLLHLLQIMDVMNVMVVVTRWYGGIHLGSDRFRHINNAARQVLEQSGLVTKKK